MGSVFIKPYSTPIGELLLGSFNNALCLCDWRPGKHNQRIDERLQSVLAATYREGTSDCIVKAQLQLGEYFSGKRQLFDIPLLFVGTDFQLKVWKELIQIPYGETISYAELAKRIGKPTAIRAVANANGANSLSVFVPCHRVIGSNSTLTGYGGGLVLKQQLLDLECGMRYHQK